MTEARIYQPAKTAMQSGRAGTRRWVLELVGEGRRAQDPLMGWTGSADTDQQVRLKFASKDEAVAFAEANGYAYAVAEPHTRRVKPKNYADNFRYDNPLPSSG